MLLANSYLPYFAYGVSSQIAYADAPPVLSVTFDVSKNELELSVNTSSEVSYVVAYTRVKDDGYQVEGLEGKGEDASGIFKKKLYAGTCSAVDCIDHEVKRALVKVQVEDLSWAYEHRYILEESNAFSLVGEGKIENDNDVSNLLELTEDNKKWLEDVNTIQPSLTPTPTCVSSTYYLDADGDGYGDNDSTVQACSAPVGYVADNTDCNDSDSSVYPGAPEIAGDGIDQDCDGLDALPTNTPTPTPSELLVINEIDYDQPGTDDAEFIEIKNNGQTAVNLDNYEVRTINNGAPPSIGHAFDLPNVSLASGDYFVICAQSGNTPNCDMDVSPDTNLLQQGPDAVALFFKSASSEVLVDTVSYGGDTPGYTETAGTIADNVSLGTVGLSRFPDGQDTNDNSADFILSCISPGLANTSDTDCDKVTICHSTSAHANPYNSMNPSKSADVQGHDGHNGGVYPSVPWGDIIPPFYYSCDSGICTYPGKNWTTEGQAIWNNDCNIPGVSPTATPTFTPTNTPTPTSTPTSTPPAGRCGDGIENDNEQCDYGPLNGQSSCSSECTWINECRQEMVANGSFETPVVSQGTGWDVFNNAQMAGWTAEWYGGFSDYNGNTRPEPKTEVHQGVNGWLPASGAQYVELDTDWTGPSDGFSGEPASIALSQDIPTIPGYEYTLGWKYSARPNHNNNHLQVVVGNTEMFNSGNLAGGSSTNWQAESYTFVATTSLTRISFIEIGMTDSLGMFVDDVSVACTEQGATPTPTATSTPTPTNTPTTTPTPIACVQGAAWSGNYVSHTQGLRKNGTPITDVARMNPWKAVGPADGQFYSLGYGGTIILELSGYAVDVLNAPDLSFHEVTNGRNSYGVETATVEVSQDGSTWVSIGNVTNKDGGNGIGYLDLNGSGLLWAKYVKITDITSDPALEATADGYDLDAVDVVEQVCEEPKPPTKIIAHKIICENETYLPNWHNGANINANTAQNFVNNSNGKCWFAQDWDFQWGFADKSGQQGVDKLSGEVLGLAAGQSSSGMCNVPYCGPNTQTGTAYNQWKTFGPTNENGVTEVSINNLESAPGIWVRESLKADYVPFSYPPQASPGSNVSAEMYCHTDVANYDNFDQIVSPQSGQSYYCVAFNAPVQKDVTICKVDGDDQPLANWTVGLAQQNPLFNDQIPVTNGSGIDASLPAGDHVVFAFGTYRYGNSAMIADAGFSYRPLNVPMGADGWVSGDQLSTVGGLELKVGGQNIAWGGYSPAHQYTTLVSGFAGGNLNLNVWDNQYNDNLNNGNFRARIHEVLATGVTGDNGCVTLEDVPYGDYVAFELPQAHWSHVSTQVNGQDSALFPAPVTVSEQDTTVIFENRLVTGQLRVQKTTIPSGDPTEFSVTVSGGGQVYGAATGSVTDVADYTFTVEPNIYSVSEDVPSNWEQTSNSCSGILVPSDGERVCQITNTQSYDIHGYKWNDANRNGVNDREELLSGWEIFIDQNNNQQWDAGEPKTTTSGDDEHYGWYWFEGLLAGTYDVCEVVQSGWAQTYPVDPICHTVTLPDLNPRGMAVSVNMVAGPEYNFGNTQYGDVVVYKFHDLNNNGQRDNGEPLLPNWDITMSLTDGPTTTQSTDSSGSTTFVLGAGDYVLDEIMQEGWYQSNIYCEGAQEGVKITQDGWAYGHHGMCSRWNKCGDAATCALKACQANGYDRLVSYGDARPCTQFENCSLFHNIDIDLSYQEEWGNWCDVMGVTDIYCSNGSMSSPTPTPTPIDGDESVGLIDRILGVSSVFAQKEDENGSYRSGLAVTVEPGEQKTCYVGNYQKATITVNKNVINHVDQDITDDFPFDVDAGEMLGTHVITETSPHVFTVNPGTYTFQEINIDSRYYLDAMLGDENAGVSDMQVTVLSGASKSVTFVNKKVEPVLRISKFNDKWPTPQAVGADVTYTITIEVLDNDMVDVKVIDLPPGGFAYKSGSWKALKNGVPYSIPQPVYSSPGTWLLGNLAMGDVVVLTYVATIGTDSKPGVYKDLAWAYGCADSTSCAIDKADMVLASSADSTKTDPGIITDTVVGTQIEIEKVGTPSNTINILEKRDLGNVLGATSARRLPATGVASILVILGFAQLLVGLMIGLWYLFKTRMKYTPKMIAILLTIFGVLSVYVYGNTPAVHAALADEIVVRVEQPRSPTNEGFNLGFVALDMMNRQLTARCYVKSPKNSWNFTQFGSDITLKAGGDSGACKVETGALAEGDNIYEVRVTVLGSPASPYVAQAETITVKYISTSTRPGNPRNYDRFDLSSCEKKITFWSADDGGKTVRVEVYRGDSTEFTLNDGTKVATFTIGSNTQATHVELVPDCNKKYYYALRAFDAAGNYSDPVGDKVVETVTSSTGSTSAEVIEEGALIVQGSGGTGGQVLGEQDGLTAQPSPKGKAEGEVLGEKVATPESALPPLDNLVEEGASRSVWAFVGVGLLVGGLAYAWYYRARQKNKTEQIQTPQTKK